jgi:hypothetical protein
MEYKNLDEAPVGADYEDLLKYEFRKWTLKKFLHSIFFRNMNNTIII